MKISRWIDRFRGNSSSTLVKFPTAGIQRRHRKHEFFLILPHVNRIDLTRRALKSIEPWWRHVVVIDASLTGELRGSAINEIVRVESFPGATFSQVQNLAWARAVNDGYAFYFSMHNDAAVGQWTEPSRCELDPFLNQEVRAAFAGSHCGMVLTNYDALVAFRTMAVERVGPWDTNLPWYLADNDYYRRMKLAGWTTWQATSLPVQHDVSQTLKADPTVKRQYERMGNYYQSYYTAKWGGPVGRERFRTPWNGET